MFFHYLVLPPPDCTPGDNAPQYSPSFNSMRSPLSRCLCYAAPLFILLLDLITAGSALADTTGVKNPFAAAETAATATPTRTPTATPVVSTPAPTASAIPAPQFAEGIVGDIDSRRRSPVVSVRTENGTGGVKIFADAYVPNTEYVKYPIEFQFFVNRQLFATQLRSNELPGPVGVDIGRDFASPPFNYSIVATVLHPNRQFTTVVNGAVYSTDLATTFVSCTLTEGSSSTMYVSGSTSLAQESDTQLAVPFIGTSADGTKTKSLSFTLNLTGTKLSGSATDSESRSETAVSGTATVDGGKITEISVASPGDALTLTCS